MIKDFFEFAFFFLIFFGFSNIIEMGDFLKRPVLN